MVVYFHPKTPHHHHASPPPHYLGVTVTPSPHHLPLLQPLLLQPLPPNLMNLTVTIPLPSPPKQLQPLPPNQSNLILHRLHHLMRAWNLCLGQNI